SPCYCVDYRRKAAWHGRRTSRPSSLRGLKEAGGHSITVFASATVVNIVVALGPAAVVFGSFELR
ncbi:MAG TPA: hypothetical protein VHI10_09795, partial [Mycobacterium sp.]|nr:hypothetical protein [Mycobacterium sp.]